MISHPGSGHEITLVGRVDEDLALELATAFHDDLDDARAFFDDPTLQIETLAEDDWHLRFFDHVVVNLRRHMRLEGPHRFLVDAVTVGSVFEIVLAGLQCPRGGIGVVLPDAVVELAGEAPNGFLVADVGGAEATGGQAAEKL